MYAYRMLLHGAPDLDQKCPKTRSSKDRCTFHQIYSPLHPKSPKTPFWGPFNAKPIIERALRKSDVIGATKLKQVLGGVKIRPLGASGGDAGPPNVNLGPPDISKITTARRLK